MFFGGGFPGGMGGGSGRSRGPVNNEKLYNILGVERSCSESDLKKAYRKLAMKHHPDKGGDTEKFQEISHAFEILSDPEKRSVYDAHGEEGLEGSGMGGHGDGMDIFDMFFGGGGRGGGGRSRGPPKTDSVQTKLDLDLEQLYKGITKSLSIKHDIICKGCDGHGGQADKIQSCDDCNGQGFKVKVVRMGPMISQSRAPCDTCEQRGKVIPQRFRCKQCHGNKVVAESKILACNVEPGCSDGKKIVFEGEADQRPGCEPGDVIVVINEKPHPRFKREKDDLIFSKTIDLKDVLCGCSFDLQALDGRPLLVKLAPGMIQSSEQSSVCVMNEGMPRNGNPHIRGKLIINFTVTYPIAAPSPEVRATLATALSTIAGCKGVAPCRYNENDSSVEIVNATKYVASQDRTQHAYDDDEDMHEHEPQGVQCATQ